ncbi:MAG: type II toxin-antitoxin system VapC family toxin [Gammaproteobacteria bacterium]|nr:type II toxin-antitoxin system VapC family toxin [Gammaproteobacteria bacterium]
MIAIDTNVLVRYYVDDNRAQHRRARDFIDEHETFINNIVILETFWVLGTVYQLDAEKICEVFDHLKRLSNVQFEDQSAFAQALMEYRDNGCDFADALIGRINRNHGFETASFDRDAVKKLHFIPV